MPTLQNSYFSIWGRKIQIKSLIPLSLCKRKITFHISRVKLITNRDIRSGDFRGETAEDHTTRGDVAHLNLQGHKACHPSGKRPVKYKTKIIRTTTGEPHNQEQDQLQEQHGILEHLSHRLVISDEAEAITIKNPIRPNAKSNSKNSIYSKTKCLFINSGKSSKIGTVVATNRTQFCGFCLRKEFF